MTMLRLPNPDVAAMLAVADDLLRYAREQLVKASTPIAIATRDAKVAAVLPDMVAALAAYFASLADRLLPVTKADGLGWSPDDLDWRAEQDLLEAVIEEWAEILAAAGYDEAMDGLGLSTRLDLGVSVPAWIEGHVARSVTGITATTRSLIGEMVTVAVERGYSISSLVRGVAADDFPGLRSLVEGWSTSRATTIGLSETATVWNLGTIQGYRDSGLVDEVNVFDGVKDPPCAAASGAVWTLDEAEKRPTEHPRCFPGATSVVASGVTASYSRWYEGDLVVVKTATGHELTATPNHPVLTRRGWIALGEIQQGDDLVRALDPQRMLQAVDPDNDQVVASIAQAAASLPVVLPGVPSAPEDFHGDVADGDVHVVRTHGLLDRDSVPALGEPGGKLALGWRDVAAQPPLAEGRSPHEVIGGDVAATDGSVGGRRDALALPLVGPEAQALRGAVIADGQADPTPARPKARLMDAGLASELTAALSGHVALVERPGGVLVETGVAAAVAHDRNASRPHVPANRVATDAEGAGDLIERLTGLVELDRVVDHRRVQWSGHVFNLETAPGWYVADGYIVHNCQRAFSAVVAR